MKLGKAKLLNLSIMLFGLSVIMSMLTSCYGDGGQSSNQVAQNITRVNLSSDFVTKSPIEVNHSYVLSVSNANGDVLSSQIFECFDLKVCPVDLENINLDSTGFVFVRIFNGNGGLVAAALMNTTQFANGGHLNSTEVSLSEYSTGVYILAKMQQISDAIYVAHNSSIDADFVERFHLQNVEQPQKVIPMVAYKLANELGLNEGEAAGIFRLWYNIYGDSDEYDQVSASMINNSAAHMYQVANKTKGPNSNLAPIQEVDEDKEQDSDLNDAIDNLKNQNQKLLKNINLINNNSTVDMGKIITPKDLTNPQQAQQKADEVIPKKADEKKGFDWISSTQASGIAKELGKYIGKNRPPVTSEERATAEILSSTIGIVAKAINFYAPGLGSVIDMLNTFGLEALFPTKSGNPNAALEEKLTQLNQSLVNLTNSFTQRMNQQDEKTWSATKKNRRELLDKGVLLTNPYFSILSTGKKNTLEIDNVLAGGGYPGLIDIYIETSSNRKQALDKVNSLFGSEEKSDKIFATATSISSAENINDYMTALNNVRNNLLDDVKNNKSSKDYVAIDTGYYAEVLDASSNTLNTLEQLRNYQLAAAYLMLKSRYKNELGTVYLSEFTDNLEDYDEVVLAINKKYKEREIQAMEAFTNATKASNVYNDTKRWVSNIAQESSKDLTRPCTISYWDGQDLGVTCKNKGLRNSNINTKIYDIANVCRERLTLDGTRVYCNMNVSPGLAYFTEDKYMRAINYNRDEDCSFLWVFNCDVKTYNKMFVDKKFDATGFKNGTGVEYDSAQGNYQVYRLGLKRDGSVDSYGFGTVTHIGKPITNRYVTFENHKLWLLSSYNDFTSTNMSSGGMGGGTPMSHTDYSTTFTLGCMTSDCLLYKRPNGKTEMFYPDLDYYFVMEVINPKNANSYVEVKIESITVQDSAGLPKMREPFGDWSTQCNLDTMTYNGDILTATCANGAWESGSVSQVQIPSSLNVRKSCKLGSYVTVEKNTSNPVLKCVDPK